MLLRADEYLSCHQARAFVSRTRVTDMLHPSSTALWCHVLLVCSDLLKPCVRGHMQTCRLPPRIWRPRFYETYENAQFVLTSHTCTYMLSHKDALQTIAHTSLANPSSLLQHAQIYMMTRSQDKVGMTSANPTCSAPCVVCLHLACSACRHMCSRDGQQRRGSPSAHRHAPSI